MTEYLLIKFAIFESEIFNWRVAKTNKDFQIQIHCLVLSPSKCMVYLVSQSETPKNPFPNFSQLNIKLLRMILVFAASAKIYLIALIVFSSPQKEECFTKEKCKRCDCFN